jgi:hypothetical protein
MIDGNMPHDYVIFGSFVRFPRIETDFESNFCRFCSEIRQIELISCHVTAVAVLIRHCVAHLTAHPVLMERVLRSVFRAAVVYRFVAAQTASTVRHCVAIRIFHAVAVHFISGMTRSALHILRPVYIGGYAFVAAKILLFDPASVASGTGLLHRRAFLNIVAGQQPTVDTGRPADVTLTATRVTLAAMGFPRLIDYFKLFDVSRRPHIDYPFVRLERCMKARFEV